MDSLIPEVMFTFYWTPQWCAEAEASESPLILPGRPAVSGEPNFATFSDLLPGGIPRRWIWLFPNTQELLALWHLGCNPKFSFFTALQDMVQANIQPFVGRTRKTKSLKINPRIFAHVPNLELEIEEVWIGFDRDRLYRDLTPRNTARQILSVGEFLDRLKRRIV